MHIADGIIPIEYCVGAYALSLGGVAFWGRRPAPEEVARMGVLAAAAFIGSLVQFPVAGVSVHLGLFGLLGLLLGTRAFPVVFAALLLQALLFQHGGLVSLGLNSLNMGAGALAAAAVWRTPGASEGVRAFAAGFVGAMAPALLMATEFSLAGYGRGFFFIAGVYAAVAAAEGVATTTMVSFFRRMKPEILATA